MRTERSLQTASGEREPCRQPDLAGAVKTPLRQDLLADAELREDSAEQVIGRHRSGNFAERLLRKP